MKLWKRDSVASSKIVWNFQIGQKLTNNIFFVRVEGAGRGKNCYILIYNHQKCSWSNRFTIQFNTILSRIYQIAGRESQVIGERCNESGIKILKFSEPAGPVFHYEPPSNDSFGDQPLLGNLYLPKQRDKWTVHLKKSPPNYFGHLIQMFWWVT